MDICSIDCTPCLRTGHAGALRAQAGWVVKGGGDGQLAPSASGARGAVAATGRAHWRPVAAT